MHKVNSPENRTIMRRRLEVTGRVQGVGFRPFVYNLARRFELTGFVGNTASGAVVEIEGDGETLKQFVIDLQRHLPPLAKIDRLNVTDLVPSGGNDFSIRTSHSDGDPTAEVSIDVAVCDDCLREMTDPDDRRYRYPFINCTHCGPRYTIQKTIPYDRPNTTMAIFPMCPDCRAEYDDPTNRRFHAQPIACPVCGPRLTFQDKRGKVIEGDAIRLTAERLKAGDIVAIKGLGGFHLAVDATSEKAVKTLRRLKHRDHKPFALMVPSIRTAEKFCIVDDDSRKQLSDMTRPIVLMPRKPSKLIAPSVAGSLDTFGVMLPYTPYHHLLFAEGSGPLVMTSGNLSDEPIVIDNDDAMDRLGKIADYFLMHDRPIYRRVDDSVLQARTDGVMMVRRSRGFVAESIDLGQSIEKPILAVGAELKSTIAIAKSSKVWMSEYLGDLKDPIVFDHFRRSIAHLCELFDVKPEIVVADLHPDYLSTRFALDRLDMEMISVQHHHAHIVSCMVEHNLFNRVIGIAADGVGLGTDNVGWGCEVMIADRTKFDRIGHLDYFPIPGADAAARQTFRPALGLLYQAFADQMIDLPVAAKICPDRQIRKTIVQMIERKINSPPTSSLGRVFDAVACLLGLASTNHFEGQAPMLLEALTGSATDEIYPFEIRSTNETFVIDLRAMMVQVVHDLDRAIEASIIADKVHNTVAAFLIQSAQRVADRSGLTDVVLSGGCFANRNLSSRIQRSLTDQGLRCYRHHRVPCNDGGIALGQAAIGAARSIEEKSTLCV